MFKTRELQKLSISYMKLKRNQIRLKQYNSYHPGLTEDGCVLFLQLEFNPVFFYNSTILKFEITGLSFILNACAFKRNLFFP